MIRNVNITKVSGQKVSPEFQAKFFPVNHSADRILFLPTSVKPMSLSDQIHLAKILKAGFGFRGYSSNSDNLARLLSRTQKNNRANGPQQPAVMASTPQAPAIKKQQSSTSLSAASSNKGTNPFARLTPQERNQEIKNVRSIQDASTRALKLYLLAMSTSTVPSNHDQSVALFLEAVQTAQLIQKDPDSKWKIFADVAKQICKLDWTATKEILEKIISEAKSEVNDYHRSQAVNLISKLMNHLHKPNSEIFNTIRDIEEPYIQKKFRAYERLMKYYYLACQAESFNLDQLAFDYYNKAFAESKKIHFVAKVYWGDLVNDQLMQIAEKLSELAIGSDLGQSAQKKSLEIVETLVSTHWNLFAHNKAKELILYANTARICGFKEKAAKLYEQAAIICAGAICTTRSEQSRSLIDIANALDEIGEKEKTIKTLDLAYHAAIKIWSIEGDKYLRLLSIAESLTKLKAEPEKIWQVYNGHFKYAPYYHKSRMADILQTVGYKDEAVKIYKQVAKNFVEDIRLTDIVEFQTAIAQIKKLGTEEDAKEAAALESQYPSKERSPKPNVLI